MADWRAFAKQEALRQGVDPSLVLPLIGQESSWNPNAVSRKGAAGFMQLMPGTARELGLSEADRFNPNKAIPAGITYLKQQLDRFQDPAKALAAYNAGPGAVQKFGGVPPYKETQDYVRKNAMAAKTDLSDDELVALAGGRRTGGRAKPELSDDDLIALAQPSKAKRIPLKVIDKTLPETGEQALASMPWYQRAAVGAGKAGVNFLQGIGVADALGIQSLPSPARAPSLSGLITGQPAQTPAQSFAGALESDPAAIAGNIAGQAAITYAGGKLLGGTGARVGGPTGGIMQTTGRAMVNPATLREAAGGGLVAGTLLQPGDPMERLQGALGGAAGGGVGYGVGKAIGAIGQAAGRKLDQVRGGPTQELTNQLRVQLQANGLDFNALPRAAQQTLLNAAKEAVGKTGRLDPEAVRRMADFQALGIDPLKGWVTRNPEQWWMADTLNTVNPRISQRYLEANRQMVQQAGGAAPEASDYELGQRFAERARGLYQGKQAAAKGAYEQARAISGRELELDPHRFVTNVSNELEGEMTGAGLREDVLPWFNRITSGKEPFTIDSALRRLQTLNGKISRTRDTEQLFQLGIVKRHLLDAIEGYGGPQAGGVPRIGPDSQREISEAFRQARGAASKYLQLEREPVIQDVLSGKFTPEDLPDLMGRIKVDDLQNLARIDAENPGLDAIPRLRDAAAEFIRNAAILQPETGGKFTVAGLRKALAKIGPENGRLLFGDDWNNYQSLLRAGGSMMNPPGRPTGSNTYSNFMRLLGKVPIPGVPAAVNLTVTGAAKAKQALDVNRLLQPGLYDPSQALTNRQLINRAWQQAPGAPMPAMMGAPFVAPVIEYLRRGLLDQER